MRNSSSSSWVEHQVWYFFLENKSSVHYIKQINNLEFFFYLITLIFSGSSVSSSLFLSIWKFFFGTFFFCLVLDHLCVCTHLTTKKKNVCRGKILIDFFLHILIQCVCVFFVSYRQWSSSSCWINMFFMSNVQIEIRRKLNSWRNVVDIAFMCINTRTCLLHSIITVPEWNVE